MVSSLVHDTHPHIHNLILLHGLAIFLFLYFRHIWPSVKRIYTMENAQTNHWKWWNTLSDKSRENQDKGDQIGLFHKQFFQIPMLNYVSYTENKEKWQDVPVLQMEYHEEVETSKHMYVKCQNKALTQKWYTIIIFTLWKGDTNTLKVVHVNKEGSFPLLSPSGRKRDIATNDPVGGGSTR